MLDLIHLLAIKDDNILKSIIVNLLKKEPKKQDKLFEYLNVMITFVRKNNLRHEYVKQLVIIHHGKFVKQPDLYRLIQSTVKQKVCAGIVCINSFKEKK